MQTALQLLKNSKVGGQASLYPSYNDGVLTSATWMDTACRSAGLLSVKLERVVALILQWDFSFTWFLFAAIARSAKFSCTSPGAWANQGLQPLS